MRRARWWSSCIETLWSATMGHAFANCLFKTYKFPIPVMSLRKCPLTSMRALLSLTLLVITSVMLNCWSSFLLSFNYITLDEDSIKNIPDCSLTVTVPVISPAVLTWFIFWVLAKRSYFLQSSCNVTGEQELCCHSRTSHSPSRRVSTMTSSYFSSLHNTIDLRSPVKSFFYSHSKHSQT